MRNFYEVKKYELICISPVHIGSGTVLQPFEYLYDNNNRVLYIPSREKLMELLDRYSLTEKFIIFMESNADRIRRADDAAKINVYSWLVKNHVKPDDIADIAARRLMVMDNKGRATLNAVNEAICTADGIPYIPGSSIKGALRTGILYGILKRNKLMASKFSRQLEYAMNGRDFRERSQRLSNLEKELTSVALRILKQDERNGNRSVINDMMRGLKVSDAMPVEKYDTVLVQKLDASTYSGKSHQFEKQLPLFRECCMSGSKYSFSISMDIDIMKEAGIKSIDSILADIREFSKQGLRLQERVFGRDYYAEIKEAKNADFFLGAGTGFLQKSLWFSLCQDEAKGMSMLKQYLEDNFKKHRHFNLDKEISPRTLKLAEYGNQKQLIGLCGIREV